MADLEAQVRAEMARLGLSGAAVRVSGHFERATVRAALRQEPPYGRLDLARLQQGEWPHVAVAGHGIGFLLPETPVNAAGLHLHFLTADAAHGGHLLDAVLLRGGIEVMGLTRITLPDSQALDLGDVKASAAGDAKEFIFAGHLTAFRGWQVWANENVTAEADRTATPATEHRLMAQAHASAWLVTALTHARPSEWPGGEEVRAVWTERLIRSVRAVVDGLLILRKNPDLPVPASPPTWITPYADNRWFFSWYNLFGLLCSVFSRHSIPVIDRAQRCLISDYLFLRFGKTLYRTTQCHSLQVDDECLTPVYITQLTVAFAACRDLPEDLFPAAWRADGEAFMAELTAAAALIAAGEPDVKVGLFPVPIAIL
jgi:hypothetical protein